MSLVLPDTARSFTYPLEHRSFAKQGEGADGFITGVVTEKELPVIRRVMCYHRKSGKLLKTTWSDINGHYLFDGLVANLAYFITSVDENVDAVQYNAVTQDLVTASEVIL